MANRATVHAFRRKRLRGQWVEASALRMVVDLVRTMGETMVGKGRLKVDLFPGARGAFEVGCKDAAVLAALA